MQPAASRHESTCERARVAFGCCNGRFDGSPGASPVTDSFQHSPTSLTSANPEPVAASSVAAAPGQGECLDRIRRSVSGSIGLYNVHDGVSRIASDCGADLLLGLAPECQAASATSVALQ